MTIYRSLVEAMMIYREEDWQVSKKDRKRRTCGISKSDHIRNEDIRIMTNDVYFSVDEYK